VLFKT